MSLKSSNKRGLFGWGILFGMLSLGVLTVTVVYGWYLGDPMQMSLSHILEGPSSRFPLGTDMMGRDLAARLATALYSVSLVLFVLVISSTALGVVLAAIFIGWAHCHPMASALRRGYFALCEALTLIPLSLMVLVMILFGSVLEFKIIAAVFASYFVCRSSTASQQLYQRDAHLAFWQSHNALGGGSIDRIFRYGILSHWRAELTLLLQFNLLGCFVTEIALSYLGLGVPEPQASLGNILGAHFDLGLKGAFWVPGVLLVYLLMIVVSLNLLRPLANCAE